MKASVHLYESTDAAAENGDLEFLQLPAVGDYFLLSTDKLYEVRFVMQTPEGEIKGEVWAVKRDSAAIFRKAGF